MANTSTPDKSDELFKRLNENAEYPSTIIHPYDSARTNKLYWSQFDDLGTQFFCRLADSEDPGDPGKAANNKEDEAAFQVRDYGDDDRPGK